MTDSLTQFPSAADNFQIPQQPADTYLSEAEAETTQTGNTLNHPQMHQAENEAITAIENNAALAIHDHSDPQGTDYSPLAPNQKHGYQLSIANTHIPSGSSTGPTQEEAGAPDSSASAWHHTVGNSPSSIGQNQAVGGGAWNALGLNSAPNGYLNPGSTSFPNLPNQVQSNASAINSLQNTLSSHSSAISFLQGSLSSFNAYWNNRANSFLGQPFTALTFSPASTITPISAGGTTDNYVCVNLFARICFLQLRSFISAHNGVEAQVMIYKQNPQPDGSYWAPNYLIFFPHAIEMRETRGDEYLRFDRDISWKPDGNIYTSSLGNPGERDDVGPNQSVPMPYNIELVHYSADGQPLEYTNLNPFPNA